MENQITQLLIVALAIVPFCNAVVQVVKTTVTVPSRFVPILSIVIGIALGGVFTFITDGYTLTQILIAGGIAGMASCGIYDIVVPNTKASGNTTETK